MAEKMAPKTVERLSVYRRLLLNLSNEKENIFSHELAELVGTSAANVRRDLMGIDISGHSRSGHNIKELIESLNRLFQNQEKTNVAIIGLGNIGKALINYFGRSNSQFKIIAGFDNDPCKFDDKYNGCYCYPMHAFGPVIKQENIEMAIIAVPEQHTQEVADLACEFGIKSLVNFTPIKPKTACTMHLEQVDITMFFEKAFYFGFKAKD